MASSPVTTRMPPARRTDRPSLPRPEVSPASSPGAYRISRPKSQRRRCSSRRGSIRVVRGPRAEESTAPFFRIRRALAGVSRSISTWTTGIVGLPLRPEWPDRIPPPLPSGGFLGAVGSIPPSLLVAVVSDQERARGTIRRIVSSSGSVSCDRADAEVVIRQNATTNRLHRAANTIGHVSLLRRACGGCGPVGTISDHISRFGRSSVEKGQARSCSLAWHTVFSSTPVQKCVNDSADSSGFAGCDGTLFPAFAFFSQVRQSIIPRRIAIGASSAA